MTLRALNLDDRNYDDLVNAALQRVRTSCPEWTDLSPSDPGRTLIEVFAYLTDVMIYRLNRIPEKAYIEFLKLLGVELLSPSCAMVKLQLTLEDAAAERQVVPRGTRVKTTTETGQNIVFSTATDAVFERDSREIAVIAYHCDQVDAELIGVGTGQPGLSLHLKRFPIVAHCADYQELVVAVEKRPGDPTGQFAHRHYQGKDYAVWHRADDFSSCSPNDMYYTVTRGTGRITFAPALRKQATDGALSGAAQSLAAVPIEGRKILAWYRTGGGAAGNVAANTLTSFDGQAPLPGLKVNNIEPAVGGRDGESLQHALQRGPQELRSLRRAVTALDFESQALNSTGGVSRASAHTQRALWTFASRGTVEIVLVPQLEDANAGRGITPAQLEKRQIDLVREQVQERLDARRPLGTRCVTRWAHYKTVTVKAKVSVYRQEDAESLRERLLERLFQLINPIPADSSDPNAAGLTGWQFGQALTSYDIYRLLVSEIGVRDVDELTLCVDDVPDALVCGLAADSYQPQTWYAGQQDKVLRTLNDGEGWENIAEFDGQAISMVRAYPKTAAGLKNRAGLVAAVTHDDEDAENSRVYISRDCGEQWTQVFRPQFDVEDLAWVERDGKPTLLMATEKALYELADGQPVPVLVDSQDQAIGFHAIAVSTDVWGRTTVAVAARQRKGVYLSVEGGKPGTFSNVGLQDELVRVLEIQHHGSSRYLWAGTVAVGDAAGNGCFRRALTERIGGSDDWRNFNKGWDAGGCRDITFIGSKVFAGTRRKGVLTLDIDTSQPAWRGVNVNCGLPLESINELESVDHVAAFNADPEDVNGSSLLMVAGPKGVFLSHDEGITYEHRSDREFEQRVTLPPTWLFCSGEHVIEIVNRNE